MQPIILGDTFEFAHVHSAHERGGGTSPSSEAWKLPAAFLLKTSSATVAAKLERLKLLGEDQDAQAAYAERLLEKERTVDLALAALAVIKEREDVRLRPALLRKYAMLDADGVRLDPGGVVRTATMKALRPVALPEDVALAERAVATYEFLYGEAAGDLRGAGLLLLNEVDPPLAGFHSVRLLDDQYTSIMSGEPAVTAARVLAAQGQVLPLYTYVMRDEPAVADVVGEGLRSLGAIPPSLLPAVVEKYGASKSEIVLLGLFDLLLATEARPAYLPFIFDFLQSTTLYNLYRYLVIVLVTGHDPDIMERLEAMARHERDPTKREIWREARTLA